MTFGGILITAFGVWLGAAIVYQAGAWAALRRLLLRRSERAAGEIPSCTILRSLPCASPGLEANLESLAVLGVPVVVSAEDDGGPAAAMARRVAARHPGAPFTLRTGPAPAGTNRKVANLQRLLPWATGEVVVFTDADVTTPRGYLEAVLQPFGDPAVGLVTCPYRSVGGRSLPERFDVLLTNTGFLPSIAVAERLEGVRFGLGATIAVRRRLLEETGGLAPLVDLLADDHALAERIRGTGHRIVLAPILLDHQIAGTGWRDLWRRHVRWARTMRFLRPGGYSGTIVTHGSVPALALALGAGWTALAALGAWLLARTSGAVLLRRRLGLGAADLILIPAADLAAFAIFLAAWAGRSVEWGGARLRVRRDGSLLREERISGPASPGTPAAAARAGDGADPR